MSEILVTLVPFVVLAAILWGCNHAITKRHRELMGVIRGRKKTYRIDGDRATEVKEGKLDAEDQ